jgi:hypothetical protein
MFFAASLLALSAALVACATGPAPHAAAPGPHEPGGDPGSQPCTTMGCVDGLTVDLLAPGGTWAPGHYVFEVKTPAGASTCEGDLPLPACEAGPALKCSGPPIAIGASGCALPKEQHGFSSIDFPEGPAHVEVAIRRDRQPLAQIVLDPAYRTATPNGPVCGPVCRQARAALSW